MSTDGSEWPQWCSLCDAKLTTKAVADSHYGGRKHRQSVEDLVQKQKDWDNGSYIAIIPQW